MLTIAYIGNGKSTNRYHIPFALKSGRFKIKTIYSHSANTDWLPLEGVHYTQDLDDIYLDRQLDLVVVATPNQWHYHYAKACLEHGHNVLVEKPFTATLAQAQELFALAEQKDLFIQAYQNRRFDADFLTVQKVIESGRLGDLLELEMHFDYFRPQVPLATDHYSREESYLYGHACHTVDQVISYFGRPDSVHYDVRQLLGKGRMNDYFDLDFYYGALKVSVKSSYFRIKERPSFVVYGKQGMFVKAKKDRQEADLKRFYMPTQADFGLDQPEDYGVLTYQDEAGQFHEETVVSQVGDYSRFYEAIYQSIAHGAPKLVSDQETLLQMEILEQAISKLEADQ
ncbi:Gfo/Idh/MocA family oxidoreductase [Vaginisenegalia massiliensis]|uniref:Gfo/Idh/MocA family oxidoreductase n=1 Tax=Vaginisenegalia massiliensis TaxID=2058294 RepID=UPI000F53730A|nr:Gfo/Idh/MocA family oxidoreductase [Vaginisenegalia massiliensis]